MTNFDPAKLDWTASPLAGWTYDRPVNKWFQGSHRSCYRLTRPCPTCRETIVLDVTRKALTGEAANHGLSLRRCKKCREALKLGAHGDYAERKALGAERRAAEPEEVQELERLRNEVEQLKAAPLAEDPIELERLQKNDEKLFSIVRRLQTIMPATTLINVVESVEKMIEGGNLLKAKLDRVEAKLTQYELQPRIESVAKSATYEAECARFEAEVTRQNAEAAAKQAQNTTTQALPSSLPW